MQNELKKSMLIKSSHHQTPIAELVVVSVGWPREHAYRFGGNHTYDCQLGDVEKTVAACVASATNSPANHHASALYCRASPLLQRTVEATTVAPQTDGWCELGGCRVAKADR
eukprot:5599515-Pleurochrysis_carterae.AAC.1